MNKKLDIFITGKPCSLKDTASGYLSHEFGLNHLRVSSLIRQEFSNKFGENSKEIKEMNSGEIKSTKPVTEMLVEHVESNLMKEYSDIDILYDGYPRTLDQWNYHFECSKKRKDSIKILLFMKVSDEESIKRALKRFICNDCKRSQHPEHGEDMNQCVFCCSSNIGKRVDDNESTIKRRLEVYREFTEPLMQIVTDASKNVYVHHIDTESVSDLKKHLYEIIINYYGN